VDTKDWDALPALHVAEHRSFNGDYAPWTSAAEMIANVREIMKDVRTAHHSHTPEITFESRSLVDRGLDVIDGLIEA